MEAKILALILIFAFCLGVHSTPLDDYVWAPDDNYKWTLMSSDNFTGSFGSCNYNGYYINMTSQKWLTDEDFASDSQAKSLWSHIMIVIVPETIRFPNNGSLYITGGGQGMGVVDPRKDRDVIITAGLACGTQTITTALFQIPNMSVKFAGDSYNDSRGEDAVIAYTWDHFLNDPSKPEWLLRFPMVKASLRAMDTITAFVKQLNGNNIQHYAVAGASKRGWTTWLVGAVDQTRVKAIIPIVLDAINFVKVMHHQFRSYGGWSFALVDYIQKLDLSITSRFDDPNMLLMSQYIDPYFYADRLTMPKMIVNAGADEFQQPDDTHYWWSDMPEPKHFTMVPNAEHSMLTGVFEIVPAIGTFLVAQFSGQQVPKISWIGDDNNGVITATVKSGTVHAVNVWWSYSCGKNAWDNNKHRRDFRIAHKDFPCKCGLGADGYCANLKTIWNRKTIQPMAVNNQDVYNVSYKDLGAPNEGTWIAFMIDFQFEDPNGLKFYTREVMDEFRSLFSETKKESAFMQLEEHHGFGGIPLNGGYFQFTTEVAVWPNQFPYDDCHGNECGERTV